MPNRLLLYYRQILKINNKIAPAHYNLALLLKNQGKLQAAEKSLKAALKCNPDYGLAWRALARLSGDRGHHREAVREIIRAAELADYSGASLQDVAHQLELAADADLGAAGDEAMRRCLSRDDVLCDGLIVAVLARLRRNVAFKRVLKPGVTEEKVAAELEDPSRRQTLLIALQDPFVAAAFAGLILPVREVGMLIDVCRTALAGRDTGMEPEAVALLALQLELTEYALEIPAVIPVVTEQSGLEECLYAALFSPLPPEVADALLTRFPVELFACPWARELLVRSGPQKLREKALAAGLPKLSLSKSDNAVSLAVRAQYEESPYPRWRGLRSGNETTLPKLVKSLFPHLTLAVTQSPPRVLVAGAGTGRHALRTAVRINGAVVTAIDLSRASLGYAARQAEVRNITNITFATADILDLPESLGVFDLIECCGVLHHMADPEAGWKALLPHLARKGLMKIALYSEAARQDVVTVRDRIGAGVTDLTLDDIRHLRRQLLELPREDPAATVTEELDFFSLSGCRDLLFHQQEQHFDISRVGRALVSLNLEFLGFEFLNNQTMRNYHARYPADREGRNLANWAAVEAESPELFRGMYQFWCRAR
ncbi:methyltransferase domain-containing protein [Sneathiella sp.]|uniref:class I SAM-dependent methyltransferase n=1 Tax=Sneathiella sp. TaxID=1964365 RepID=UPI003569AA29